jgi:hypothetical protein
VCCRVGSVERGPGFSCCEDVRGLEFEDDGLGSEILGGHVRFEWPRALLVQTAQSSSAAYVLTLVGDRSIKIRYRPPHRRTFLKSELVTLPGFWEAL